ncbi:S8 family serine peptidase [Streptomyces hyaluromycini]|uniref:S8 family serine peptidase n=1 Tax=Streptomyces hyaluromycini TaxID=1377993 RepID=UPI00142D5B6C|nr:S8 family serine peptidase [Streptomyces hyaluromycini]
MADSRTRGFRCTGGTALAAALLCCATGTAVADGTPSPLPSAGAGTAPALRLPVVPARLDLTRASCTKPSGTVTTEVPWAQQNLELTRAHQLTRGAGVTVAVVDTGVSAAASGLSGRVTGLGAGATQDCVGHGTFVAGIIAAASRTGSGFSGVAPAARILAVRGTGTDGTPDEARVAAGIRAATDAGAGVVDVSQSFPSGTAALNSALEYAARHDVLVVAAGVPDTLTATSTDSGDQRPTVAYWPATRPGVLSVVDLDIDGARPDGAVDPARADLAAPGQGITGIGPSGKGSYLANGPSVAAAFVAGAAALVRAYHPDLTAAEVRTRLVAGAYPGEVPRLNPYGALSAVLPTAEPSASTAASHAIRLTPVTEDPAPARRAYTVLAASGTAAAVLTATALLARRRRDRTTTPDA